MQPIIGTLLAAEVNVDSHLYEEGLTLLDTEGVPTATDRERYVKAIAVLG